MCVGSLFFCIMAERIHTTNYFDTFIEVAPDTRLDAAKIPVVNSEKKTIAALQFEKIANQPYQMTSDEVLFQIFAERNELTSSELEAAKIHFFSKGQACFRASPLTKTYGFGIHFNAQGKMALVAMESETYVEMLSNESIQKVKAMRSTKK